MSIYSDALSFIDPNMPRNDWVGVLAACKTAGIAFDDVVAWCEPAANFESVKDVRSAWNSITDGIVPDGYLIKLARENGYSSASAPIAKQRRKPPELIKDDIATIQRILGKTASFGDTVRFIASYLYNRGLDLSPPAILRAAELDYWHDGRMVGRFDCMVAPITMGAELRGLHLTYLSGGRKLQGYPAKKMRTRYSGAISGAAVQLYKPSEYLAIAEGIETALAVRQITGLPVWACLSAGGMEKIILPPIKKLCIFADNDDAGIQASERLKARAIKQGMSCEIAIPEQSGADWLDVLRGGDNE
ncbi:toprim domain-containing protein [Suttonella sp. R2A3]|uniref:toprim domain-containing protein n=1 Tax=Suttonella sp. R2A3 TaxID=2908648 RepID=UPI001F1679F3|nr:toprim domain-containing protein [Suttonella sp. R2A3]UJF24772.1 toprim domain-containing protein [Suttonella sp. R2A3]